MKESLMTRRGVLLAGAGSLLASGCFGSFGLTKVLYDWNEGVSDNKWLQWFVFLGMVILPVYGLGLFIDALILNTIEFWTGKHPVGHAHRELGDGQTLTSYPTTDPDMVRHEHRRHGVLMAVFYVKRVGDGELQLLDGEGKLLVKALEHSDGQIVSLDGEGQLLASLDPQQREEASRRIAEGGSIGGHLAAALGPAGGTALAEQRGSTST